VKYLWGETTCRTFFFCNGIQFLLSLFKAGDSSSCGLLTYSFAHTVVGTWSSALHLLLIFSNTTWLVNAFDLEGQTGQVGASPENAHNSVIHSSYKHVVSAGWGLRLERSTACPVCRHISYQINSSSVGMSQE